ncbi:hypothetical protein F4779DRAFT_621986 [Xylariaceae sp. FL0662B]|nr:hypothetical protein F4779DRAFT_621986 [Xylariaceae sp. FL0662B]
MATEADWDPRFGGCAVRKLYKRMKESESRNQLIAETPGALVAAQEIHCLLGVHLTSKENGHRSRTVKLTRVSPPLLPVQLMQTEAPRLRINLDIGRDVKQPTMLNGNTIARGSLLKALTMVSYCICVRCCTRVRAGCPVKYSNELGQTRCTRNYDLILPI